VFEHAPVSGRGCDGVAFALGKTIQPGGFHPCKKIALEDRIPAVGQKDPARFFRKALDVIEVEQKAKENHVVDASRKRPARSFAFQKRKQRFAQGPKQTFKMPPPNAEIAEIDQLCCVFREEFPGVCRQLARKKNKISILLVHLERDHKGLKLAGR